MSRHLASTPTTSRSSTPQPLVNRSGSGSAGGVRKSHIVPFTRPGSGSGASEDAGAGSFKTGEDAVQRLSVSLQQQRSRLSVSQDGTSFSDYSSSHGSLRRPDRRSSANFARGPGFVRQEGFLNVPTEHASEANVTSPRPPVAPGGLLSREFSSDSLPAARPAPKSASEQLKVSKSRVTVLARRLLAAGLCVLSDPKIGIGNLPVAEGFFQHAGPLAKVLREVTSRANRSWGH